MYLPPYIRDIHGTAFPTNPFERELFYRDDLHQLYYWNGLAWVTAGPGMVIHDNTWHAPAFATQADLLAHIATTVAGVHGSSVAAAISTLIHRDAAGRAQIVNPAVNADIDNMGSRNTAIAAAIAIHAALTTGVHGLKGFVSFGAYRNVDQVIPTGVHTVLDWTNENWDTHGYFDLVNNRFLPSISGTYCIMLSWRFNNMLAGDTVYVRARKNGASWKYLATRTAAQFENIQEVSAHLIQLNGTTDYTDWTVWQNSGVNRAIDGGYAFTWVFGFLVAQS